MKLSALASQYVVYKQDMGMRFHTEARTLKSFCRTMGDVTMAEITPTGYTPSSPAQAL
jgi:integrase/recombinase XerD